MVILTNLRFRLILLGTLSFALFGYGLYAIVKPIRKPTTPEFLDISAFTESDRVQIDSWLGEQVEQSNFPSLSVVIVREGKITYLRTLGYENTWKRKVASTNTPYHVASVTKAFTASLASIMHARGIIDIDQAVTKYLPEGVSLTTQPELGAKITLRQLATHTSGLPRRVPETVQSVEGRYQLETNRLYRQLADVVLEFEPGTSDLYSNLGFGLLGHVLELSSGKSLDRLLQELLCEPLKLENTAIHVDETLHIATGYNARPQLPTTHSYRRRIAGSGGLVTTAADLGKFLTAHMEPGFFSNEMLTLLHTETKLADGRTCNRALGWYVDNRNPAGRILSKNGGRNNCGSWIGFVPEHRVGVAVITNTGEPDVDDIGRWLLERCVPGGSLPATINGFAKVAPYSGVRWENEHPVVKVENQWAPLVSIDGISIEKIMKFAKEEFGDRARKRFTEDLPELMWKMGHKPKWEVLLELERKMGKVVKIKVLMTEENRARVRN